MTVVALLIAVVAVFVSAVTAAALIELYANVKQIRDSTGLSDEPIEFEITDIEDQQPSSFGLPAIFDTASLTLLFMSPKCVSCDALAAEIGSVVPDGIQIVVTATDYEQAIDWLGSFNVPVDDAIIDADRSIADGLGLHATPAAVVLDKGRVARALTVPSPRWLQSLRPSDAIRLRRKGA